MNIVEILKNVPKGTKLYSPIIGECELEAVYLNSCYPIKTTTKLGAYSFTSEGLLYKEESNGECMLFPSRENRDWSTFNLNKFDVSSLKPFDRVLVRDDDMKVWTCGIYSHFCNNDSDYRYVCTDEAYKQCIPYNDDTEHFVGKTSDCPEYYKTW